ncbi:hypothetical protein [Halobacteriovorax sp. JY17]|uniref:hypothetical protein n=1 Tax=Halobacteriovorax sp. JY17 TaxID=2014617 RepID=UPI000C5619BD|nr:hypothetical protein [Halobacteriovorax sp. JY17]PIK15914.1 MAG: hypothetical protein CES88_04085 [Halobacteriovorax sp. JY17]
MDDLKRNGTFNLKTSKRTFNLSALVVFTLLLTSCVPSQSGGGKRSAGAAGVANTPASVNIGFGRVLHDNPIILSGNPALDHTVNLNSLLKTQQDKVINAQYLQKSCINDPQCFEVKKDNISPLYQSTSQKWAFDASTVEFDQVQMFTHMDWMISKYNLDLGTTYSSYYGPGATGLPTSIPMSLFNSGATWDSSPLRGYALCDDLPNNAFFSPSTYSICLGFDDLYTNVKFVQDPTTLYHELGHALVHNAMNFRTRASGTVAIESNLGYFAYDEGKAINEGLADFFSYYMTGRAHIGEWAMGRFLKLSRPMSESDDLHATGVSETSEGRLSYPTYLSYDPNNPEENAEEIHYAGQIMSHFLVAFTKDLQNACSFDNSHARSFTFRLLMETMAYLGDFSSYGIEGAGSYGVNHTPENAKEWLQKNKPVTFRRFAQTFARFVKTSVATDSALCNFNSYNIQRLEQLLDDYGLLLFKNYDINGSRSLAESLQKVEELNRQKSVLIKKNQVIVDNRAGKSTAFIFDSYTDMNAAAKSLTNGFIDGSLSNTIFENGNLKYNNGNGQISPGELVGVLLNLYNNSNSTMAGLRILANDWDHMQDGKPCNNLSDNFPSTSQGGVTPSTHPGCAQEALDNGVGVLDNQTVEPVCFFQDTQDDAAVWVNQETFMNSKAIEATECLGGSSETKDCLIRAPKGADVAWYSRLDPKKTWAESLVDSDGDNEFKASNIFFLEVSPSVPPGTTVNCRLRVAFTNCEDCHNKGTEDTGNTYSPNVNTPFEQVGDEYKDYKYSGADPFKIINFQFTVID